MNGSELTRPASPPAGHGQRVEPAWPPVVHAMAAGAVLLRLLLFLGRGDYLAFDEGFYLLLGRALFTGDGFSLIGVPHLALSPLFPALAGAVGATLGDWVWGGRIVAAVAAGLLVLPCWAVFRRLAPRRTALIAAGLVAVLPSLAPFVAPYWIGADLWVGAEPLLHLIVYAALALWLAALERGGAVRWAATGAVLGLAFLARPEAILVWGFLGLVALGRAAAARSVRRVGSAALMGAGFLVVCAPYWVHLHDVTGRWSITGRGIAPTAAATQVAEGGDRQGPAGVIERMLWQNDRTYEQVLYGLDASGLRMRSAYWGVYPPRGTAAPAPEPGADAPEAAAEVSESATDSATEPPIARDRSGAELSVVALYFRSLGQIIPLLLWPFVILGAAAPRPRTVLRRELTVALPLLATSIVTALVVATDPRTQLFLAPLLVFYAARGFALIEEQIHGRAQGGVLRPGFIELTLAAIAVVWMLGIDLQRLRLSLTLGSPHHIVGGQNRQVAEDLDTLLGGDVQVIMSWHPAIAVFADRDWRPLPYADFPRIIRYAAASGADAIVASAYYPPDLSVERLDTRYLLLPVPEQADRLRSWALRIENADSIRVVGRLVPR